MEAHFEISRPPLDLWHQNESRGGLDSWFWALIGLAHKMRQRLNWQFTDCLEKHDFLQTTPIIGILYTVGNHFSPRVWIWDSYLKIRLRLARINYQSFFILHGKACRRSGTFFVNGGYHYNEEIERNLLEPRITVKSGRRKLFHHCEEMAISRTSVSVHCRTSTTVELGFAVSTPSESLQLACVTARPPEVLDRGSLWRSKRKKEWGT